LKNLIPYIHCNPVSHGFTDSPGQWQHSSYHAYLNGNNPAIDHQTGLSLYSSIEHFKEVHKPKDFEKYDPDENKFH